jgi:molecular chaperone GrpE (heat shock protein)
MLADFAAWLDELSAADLEALQASAGTTERAPGLVDLYGELIALRQDLRLQGRNSQTAAQRLETLSGSLGHGLEQACLQLATAAADLKGQLPEARREAQRSAALELVALAEGIERSQAAAGELALPALLWGRRREALRQTWRQAHDLLAARAREAMRRLRIGPVAAAGEAFDPVCMRAVGSSRDGRFRPGEVSLVVLQGYRLGADLLQTADVHVESSQNSHTPESP